MNAKAEMIEEEEISTPTAEETQAAIDKANNNPVAKPEEVSTESDPDDDEDMWGTFAQDLESDDDEEDSQELVVDEVEQKETEQVAPEPTPEPEPVTQTAEETKAVEETPAPVAETPAPEVATPQQIEPAPEVPVQQSPPEPQFTPEELQAKQKEARAKTVETLAGHYSLSEEDATTLITDPGKIMPKLRAEMFMDTFDAVMNGVTKAIPGIIQNMNTQTQAREKEENAFYKGNPLLSKDKHADTVNRLASAYLQAVPNATPEQMIKEVGVQAMFLLGINPAQQAQPQKESQPAQDPAPAPYVPPGAGSVSQPAPAKDNNIWGQIADELLDED